MFLAFDQVSIFEFLSGVGAYDGIGKVWRHILVWVLWPEFGVLGDGWLSQFSGGVEIFDIFWFFNDDGIGNDVCAAAEGVSGLNWCIVFVVFLWHVMIILGDAWKRRERVDFCWCTLGSG